MLTQGQTDTLYRWPTTPLDDAAGWSHDTKDGGLWRAMPESSAQVALDSRWPAFFPSPISFVTTGEGELQALEKVVGASIVNRFPYLVALSFCRDSLSERHYARSRFLEVLERSGRVAVQFLAPGVEQDAVMEAISTTPDEDTEHRVVRTGLTVRKAVSSAVPVFDDAFMVYEAELVGPSIDQDGRRLFERPWVDVGSHRIYFFRITTIQLEEAVASGRSQVHWRSLPSYDLPAEAAPDGGTGRPSLKGYVKGYTPDYRFPAKGTIAFHRDFEKDGMAVMKVRDEVIEDDDDARWPCFFPQSAGIITSRSPSGIENVMPCGSTTIVSRHPLVVAPCVSYAAVNERYAPRASLDAILESGWFGCGVPFLHDAVIDSIRFSGNTSLREDVDKLAHSGFSFVGGPRVPVLTGLPVFYECELIGHEYLGTHVMLFGRVNRIRVAEHVSPENPLKWCPWPDVP